QRQQGEGKRWFAITSELHPSHPVIGLKQINRFKPPHQSKLNEAALMTRPGLAWSELGLHSQAATQKPTAPKGKQPFQTETRRTQGAARIIHMNATYSQ
ncbi:MAG: hypothetical protein Q4A11_06675, partial [Brachymonas sp.]|nr:hypothetical protein [Brachymonas sp.]